jgi:arabinofuranosyltransferase
VGGALLLAALLVPRNPVTAPVAYTMPPDFHGIADERGYYHRWTGLLPRLADDHAEYEWAAQGREFRRLTAIHGPSFQALESVGMCAYFAGPDLYVVDRFALSNAFLARLPANRTWFRGGWRVGHYYRDFPEGYLESVGRGRNMIRDKRLAALYDDVQRATTGPLFSRARWAALWRLNTRRGPVR